jgi:Ca2+-binding RTX toxin-like protein
MMVGRSGTRTVLGVGGTSGPRPAPTVFIRSRPGLDLAVSGGKGDDEIDAITGIGDGPIAPNTAETRLTGRGGADIIDGSDGEDRIVGDEGHDVANGHGGEDSVKGSSHSDTLFGGAGDDLLLARDGLEDDLVDCGAGDDVARTDALDAGRLSACETVEAGPGGRRPGG